jgi:hypothetical protein
MDKIKNLKIIRPFVCLERQMKVIDEDVISDYDDTDIFSRPKKFYVTHSLEYTYTYKMDINDVDIIDSKKYRFEDKRKVFTNVFRTHRYILGKPNVKLDDNYKNYTHAWDSIYQSAFILDDILPLRDEIEKYHLEDIEDLKKLLENIKDFYLAEKTQHAKLLVGIDNIVCYPKMVARTETSIKALSKKQKVVKCEFNIEKAE